MTGMPEQLEGKEGRKIGGQWKRLQTKKSLPIMLASVQTQC